MQINKYRGNENFQVENFITTLCSAINQIILQVLSHWHFYYIRVNYLHFYYISVNYLGNGLLSNVFTSVYILCVCMRVKYIEGVTDNWQTCNTLLTGLKERLHMLIYRITYTWIQIYAKLTPREIASIKRQKIEKFLTFYVSI